MSGYDHLKFLHHGDKAPPAATSAATFGGVNVPTLTGAGADTKVHDKNRSQHQKHVEVVDYLKELCYDTKSSYQEIYNALRIDLRTVDKEVMEMMKENPKIEINEEDGQLYFRYRTKYEIRNKLELYSLIGKIKSGVCMKDVMESYPSVLEDVQCMVQSGDIIACKNKKAKDTILYPRGNSFLTKLSGTATTAPEQEYLVTSDDLTGEIRRGDAVLVGESWFRVSSWINSAKANQPSRAKAPLSVTSVHSLSADNEGRYIAQFTKTQIPLDSGYDGDKPFTGDIFRHGVTNDLRAKWIETATDFRTDKFRDANDLERELLRLKLITAGTLIAAHGGKRRKPIVEPGRKLRRRIKSSNARRTNVHMGEDPPSSEPL